MQWARGEKRSEAVRTEELLQAYWGQIGSVDSRTPSAYVWHHLVNQCQAGLTLTVEVLQLQLQLVSGSQFGVGSCHLQSGWDVSGRKSLQEITLLGPSVLHGCTLTARKLVWAAAWNTRGQACKIHVVSGGRAISTSPTRVGGPPACTSFHKCGRDPWPEMPKAEAMFAFLRRHAAYLETLRADQPEFEASHKPGELMSWHNDPRLRLQRRTLQILKACPTASGT